MRFGQNVLRMIWKERFVQFSWKAHCFPFLERIWGQCDNFYHFNAHECDLAKTCCAWSEKSVLYNLWKVQFSRFEDNFRPVWPVWQLWRSKMRFSQNVLCMTWKEGFKQFSWKAHCFPFLERIGASVPILTTLTLTNAILPKRAGHVLKRTFCTIFVESALFSRFEENLRQV